MGRRAEVLAALRGAAEAGVSGEALAEQLGVTRAAVAKHIAALQELGYAITAVPGRGYRLDAVPDLPLPEEVAPLLVSDMWVRLEGGVETASTNDDAKRLARGGAPEGTVVLAARQTAGRGRLGREWESPVGGVYLSAVLRPNMSVGEIAPLPLVVSVAVARAVEALGVERAEVKWPNDVWAGGGKLAGVLLETSAESDRVEWVVVGIGLNVRRPPAPTAAQEGAAYVDDVARTARVGLARAAAALLDSLAAVYADFGVAGFARLRPEYEQRSMLVGRRVAVRGADGAERASGQVVGVDEVGRLLLERGGAIVAVASGDVTLRPSPR